MLFENVEARSLICDGRLILRPVKGATQQCVAPEEVILAIGGVVREPVVAENDALEIRSRMKVAISADHRLLDGVVAAKFLQEVKKSLEAPFSLLS